MNVQELENSIAEQTNDRRERRKIRNYAETLSHLGQVGTGSHLVALIGRGDEKSNTEALCTWIKKEIKHCNLNEASELDYLYARLLQAIEYRVD